MPRLSIQAPEVTNHYELDAGQEADVCQSCFDEVWTGADQISHKPYEKMGYGSRLYCVDCGIPLNEEDNGSV